MRPFPPRSAYGGWDKLPDGPDESTVDTTNPHLQDTLKRRALLMEQWRGFYTYPRDVWSDQAIDKNPDYAEAWRNWFLRRSWEGISLLNGILRRDG